MINEKLKEDIKTAMKQKLNTLQVLRSISAAIKQYEVDNRGVEITDVIVTAILKKMVKQRQDSITAYEKANRPDLLQIELFEKEIIETYLPEQVSEETIRNAIQELILENKITSIKELGQLMKLVKDKFANQNVNMSYVSKFAKDRLTINPL